uniref:AlNc14C88G5597 protein n=1 Tax=Albugo laibachii Nc14 TaxID=890382 RepID=F0WG67_9STRA|nr:AlNc14C88G5597 [Albugo laibachii Nc14]|eukprot:CCA20202.1 AlNc14C88G5597 [Albugo laibachii Nc14]
MDLGKNHYPLKFQVCNVSTQSGGKVYIRPIILRLGKMPPIVIGAADIQPISILRIAKPTLQAMGIKVKQNRLEYIKTKCPVLSSYCTYTITISYSKPELDIRIHENKNVNVWIWYFVAKLEEECWELFR